MKLLRTILVFSLIYWIYTFFASPIYPNSSELLFIESTKNISANIEELRSSGNLLFLTPLASLKLFSLITKLNLFSLSLFKVSIFLLSGFIFFTWIQIKYNKYYSHLALILYLILPWSLFFTAYNLNTLISLLFINLFLYFDSKSNKIKQNISLTLLGLSSWPGLAFFFALTLNKLRKRKYKYIIVHILFLVPLLFYSRTYVVESLTAGNSFINQIKPSQAKQYFTEEINTQFLSVNQKYLVPRVYRKYIFNYPALLSMEVGKKAISYFDIEQMITPLDSFAITSRSGLAPKGNWYVVYIWALPLAAIGLRKTTKLKYFNEIFISSFIVFLLFSKKEFIFNQILLLPFLCISVLYGLSFITKNSTNFIYKTALLATIFMSLFQYIHVFNIFRLRHSDFIYTHGYAYYAISEIINENTNNYDKFYATDRFGPIDKVLGFYLSNTNNITFKAFNADTIEKGALYIGLSEEFTIKIDKHFQTKDDVNYIKKVKIWEPPVTNYGDEIWAGYIN